MRADKSKFILYWNDGHCRLLDSGKGHWQDWGMLVNKLAVQQWCYVHRVVFVDVNGRVGRAQKPYDDD